MRLGVVIMLIRQPGQCLQRQLDAFKVAECIAPPKACGLLIVGIKPDGPAVKFAQLLMYQLSGPAALCANVPAFQLCPVVELLHLRFGQSHHPLGRFIHPMVVIVIMRVACIIHTPSPLRCIGIELPQMLDANGSRWVAVIKSRMQRVWGQCGCVVFVKLHQCAYQSFVIALL